MPTATRPASPDQAALLRELLERRLLIASGVPGVYGRGGDFEDVRERFAALVTRAAAAEAPEQLRFPPILPRSDLERIGYLNSFPHLAGSIFAFEGTEAQAAEQYERACCHEDWSEFQGMTDLVLTPAACYPVYPAIAARGPLPAGGVTVDAGGAYVFRREPSEDPARLQMFHQREIVRLGEPRQRAGVARRLARAGARAAGRHRPRGRARPRLRPVLRPQRPHARRQPAPAGAEVRGAHADRRPRADRGGVVQLSPGPLRLGVRPALADGEPAHTACLGFGLERITIALLATHGFDIHAWPAEVGERLWER